MVCNEMFVGFAELAGGFYLGILNLNLRLIIWVQRDCCSHAVRLGVPLLVRRLLIFNY